MLVTQNGLFIVMSKRWTPEHCDAQRQAVQRWRPWESSTGPITPEGLDRTNQNATKHGTTNRQAIELRNAVDALLAGIES